MGRTTVSPGETGNPLTTDNTEDTENGPQSNQDCAYLVSTTEAQVWFQQLKKPPFRLLCGSFSVFSVSSVVKGFGPVSLQRVGMRPEILASTS